MYKTARTLAKTESARREYEAAEKRIKDAFMAASPTESYDNGSWLLSSTPPLQKLQNLTAQGVVFKRDSENVRIAHVHPLVSEAWDVRESLSLLLAIL